MLSLHYCSHKHCSYCAKKHVEVKLRGNSALPKCPQEECNATINMMECKRALRPELAELLEQRWKESRIPAQDRVYCPYPECSNLMSKAEVSGARDRCSECGREFCAGCKVPWHYFLGCPDYRKSHPYLGTNEEELVSLARTLSWRQCIKCSHMIELSSGCNHVTCRCGYEFCYACESEWNKSCGCRR